MISCFLKKPIDGSTPKLMYSFDPENKRPWSISNDAGTQMCAATLPALVEMMKTTLE